MKEKTFSISQLADIANIKPKDFTKAVCIFFSILNYLPEDAKIKISKIFEIHKAGEKDFMLNIEEDILDNQEELFEHLNEHNSLEII